jgi:hypothetical protein
MADTYYKLVPGENANKDWTSEVVLEKNDKGETTKSVSVDRPAQLNKDEIDVIESLGLKVERSSKEEAVEAAKTAVNVGEAGTAPLLGSSSNDNDEK